MTDEDNGVLYAEPLSKKELAARVRDSTYTHYSTVNAIVKSGVSVLAAYTLMHMGQDYGQLHNNFSAIFRLFLWLASSLLVFVTFVTWSRGSLMSNGRQNTRDYIIPMVVGFSELVMFLALDPQIVKQLHHVFIVWLWVVFLYSGCVFFLVLNRYNQTDEKIDFATALHDLSKEYKLWLRRDMYGAFVLVVVSFIAAVFGNLWGQTVTNDEILAYAIAALGLTLVLATLIFRITSNHAKLINLYILNTDIRREATTRSFM